MILRCSDRALADFLARAEIRTGTLAELDVCGDCGEVAAIHPDSLAQRGESICFECAAADAFDE